MIRIIHTNEPELLYPNLRFLLLTSTSVPRGWFLAKALQIPSDAT